MEGWGGGDRGPALLFIMKGGFILSGWLPDACSFGYIFVNMFYFMVFIILWWKKRRRICEWSCVQLAVGQLICPPSLFLLKLQPVPSPHYSHYSICSYKQLMCPPLLIFLSGFNQFLPPPFPICI